MKSSLDFFPTYTVDPRPQDFFFFSEDVFFWSPRSNCMKCWFWEQLFWTKGKEWRGLGHWEGQRQCLAEWFLLKRWQWVRFGVIVLLDRIWKSRKWNENCIHIQMKTSPHVPARFFNYGDMYIYVCSKRNWTGPPDAFVRLSICCVILLTVADSPRPVFVLSGVKWRIWVYVL